MSACWKVEPKERPDFYSVLALLDGLNEGDFVHCARLLFDVSLQSFYARNYLIRMGRNCRIK